MTRLAKNHQNKGLAVLAVNLAGDSPETIRRFARKKKLSHTLLMDGRDVAKKYQIPGAPTTLWIDREGIVVDTEIGFHSGKSLDEKTQKLIQ